MDYLISILISYLLGTIPAAYIMIKLLTGEDISKKGSGNVGALNSYEVSGKKWIGAAVLLIDAGKGIASVALARTLFGDEFLAIALSAVFVIVGHNFNIFLGFKGGRGLAAAAGASMLINPLIVLHWVVMWLLGYFIVKRHVHVGNLVASIFAPVLVFSTPDTLLYDTTFISIDGTMQLKLLSAAICFVILIRHIQPIKELMEKYSKKTSTEDISKN